MKNILGLICLMIILSGCENNDNSGLDDHQIMQRLIGVWCNDSNKTVQYFSDSTFIDSTNTNDFILNGSYYIENGILCYKDIHVTVLDSNMFRNGISMILINKELVFKSDTLIYKLVKLHERISGNGNTLVGEWKGDECSYHYTPGVGTYEGAIEYRYTFFPDSNQYDKSEVFLETSPFQSYSSFAEFTYNPPILNLPAEGYSNIIVNFDDNMMIWYYDRPVYKLKRKN